MMEHCSPGAQRQGRLGCLLSMLSCQYQPHGVYTINLVQLVVEYLLREEFYMSLPRAQSGSSSGFKVLLGCSWDLVATCSWA